MATEKLCFKNYINCVDDKNLSKTRRKVNKKSHKGRYYGGASGQAGGDGDSGGVGESFEPLLRELAAGVLPGTFSDNVLNLVQANKVEEEQESKSRAPKIDRARSMFQSLINQPDVVRADVIDAFINRLGITQSTAVSYYDRLAREFGVSSKNGADDSEMKSGMSDTEIGGDSADAEVDTDVSFDDEDNAVPGDEIGTIRTVDDAHLVFKRKNEEGTFDELWVYNISDRMDDELRIRHAILAGTDIPPKKTKSADGTQKYKLTTMGNAQLLNIIGLPN